MDVPPPAAPPHAADEADAPDPLDAQLYQRPGFLLRRAHQLSVGLFEEQCRALALTPPQYGVLIIVSHVEGCDQATVARALGFDRVTTLRIVRGLLARGLLRCSPSGTDARRVQLSLTAPGRATLDQARALAAGVTRRLMAPLDEAEQQTLQHLLHKLCTGLEDQARTRLLPPTR